MIGLPPENQVHQACSWILITFLIIDGSFVPRAASNFLYYGSEDLFPSAVGRVISRFFRPVSREETSSSLRVLGLSLLVVREPLAACIKSRHPDTEEEEQEEAGQREL